MKKDEECMMKRGNKGGMKKRISRFLSIMLCFCMVFQTAYLPVQAGADNQNDIQVQSEGQTETEAQEHLEALQESQLQTNSEVQTESVTEPYAAET